MAGWLKTPCSSYNDLAFGFIHLKSSFLAHLNLKVVQDEYKFHEEAEMVFFFNTALIHGSMGRQELLSGFSTAPESPKFSIMKVKGDKLSVMIEVSQKKSPPK